MTDRAAIKAKLAGPGKRPAPRQCRAMTLMEVLTVAVLIGILTVMAAPAVGTSLEQSRADLAGANLKSIWNAQRFYWLVNRTYASDLATLQSEGLLDSSIVSGSSRYSYAIEVADADSFRAAATRIGSSVWTGEFEIDETGTTTGTVSSPTHGTITPGFE